MLQFFLRRLAVMIVTAFTLSLIVFFITNMYPNLEKSAKNDGNFRMGDDAVLSYLTNRGYLQPFYIKYGQWLGVLPGYVIKGSDEKTRSRCQVLGMTVEDTPKYCGIIQGNWGYSSMFKERVGPILATRLGLTGKLMLCVMLLMIPASLVLGILAGMREGSKTDRGLSAFAITTTATPEYVSSIIFIAIFTSSAVGLKWLKGTATGAMEDATIDNFLLPVLTIALYGMGYIARMTRASMAEVMTSQYIRTARLKGITFYRIVIKHALRNALIAPFTVIMLQFPWLLNGVVIVETIFNYKGIGWVLVQAAGSNDIEMLLAVSVISVFVVLVTQLISDIGYVYLNPRIKVT
ncbi:MAG: ABC transporter permease [SAR324 cluster bacterium]|nr:ABC transporter permease [SAR324 cluster bacterium]